MTTAKERAARRNQNRYALVAYDKGAKLEGGGTIIAEGEGIELKAGQTLVLRVRGFDKTGKAMQAVEMACRILEDPYR